MTEAIALLRDRENQLNQITVDLGQARQDLEETRRAEARLSAVVQSSNDAIISMTPDCVIQTWSPGASRMLRYDQAQIAGEHIQALMRSSARDSFSKALQANLSGYDPQPYETQWRRADGSLVDVAVTVFALHSDNGDIIGFSAIARDITTHLEAKRELERLAHFDALTGLINRAQMIARLRSALTDLRQPGSHTGVLFCDIDDFKSINDTLGHNVGDLVLSTIAERIRDCVRDDDGVGRMGGDEMLVLLPGLHSIGEAVQLGEKIRSRAAESIFHFDQTVHVTLSIGATLAIPGESVSAMTARADAAMYQAKQQGRDQVSAI